MGTHHYLKMLVFVIYLFPMNIVSWINSFIFSPYPHFLAYGSVTSSLFAKKFVNPAFLMISFTSSSRRAPPTHDP